MWSVIIALIATNLYATEVYICTGRGESYYCYMVSQPEKQENNINYWEGDGFREGYSNCDDDDEDSDSKKEDWSFLFKN